MDSPDLTVYHAFTNFLRDTGNAFLESKIGNIFWGAWAQSPLEVCTYGDLHPRSGVKS